MKRVAFLKGILAAVVMLACFQAQAAVVGHLTQVDGRVELLRGGNLPSTPAKVDDTVEPQDVIRTKSLSKAQITFIDNSILTISPESRIAIEAYTVDLAQGKRQAVLEIFQGLAMAVVNKIFTAGEPDFIVKTHTAIMGVRGTEIGIRVHPNSSTIMNFQGLTQVGNIFPEVGQLSGNSSKAAHTFGPLNDKSGRWVFLKDMQATTVDRNLPPTLPYGISMGDRELFLRQLTSTVPQTSKVYQGTDNSRGAALPAAVGGTTMPVAAKLPGEQTALTTLNTVTVPPLVVPQVAAPPPVITPEPVAVPPPKTYRGGSPWPKNTGSPTR